MSGKGKGAHYSVARRGYYERKKKGEEQEYDKNTEQALKEAGL